MSRSVVQFGAFPVFSARSVGPCIVARRRHCWHHEGNGYDHSPEHLALTMKDATKLVGVDYRTIKPGIESGTIPTVQLGPRRMIPRVRRLSVFGANA